MGRTQERVTTHPLDPLDAEPSVELMRVRPPAALPGDAALVILPGSKATIADLSVLRRAGFHIDLAGHVRRLGTGTAERNCPAAVR